MELVRGSSQALLSSPLPQCNTEAAIAEQFFISAYHRLCASFLCANYNIGYIEHQTKSSCSVISSKLPQYVGCLCRVLSGCDTEERSKNVARVLTATTRLRHSDGLQAVATRNNSDLSGAVLSKTSKTCSRGPATHQKLAAWLRKCKLETLGGQP